MTNSEVSVGALDVMVFVLSFLASASVSLPASSLEPPTRIPFALSSGFPVFPSTLLEGTTVERSIYNVLGNSFSRIVIVYAVSAKTRNGPMVLGWSFERG